MTHFTIYSDGGARGNPGPAGAGAIVTVEDTTVCTISQYLGERTNNWAEYEALALALTALSHHCGTKIADASVRAFLDSELVVQQLMGKYKVRNVELQIQWKKVNVLAERFHSVVYIHIPREKNAIADALANKAMDTAR